MLGMVRCMCGTCLPVVKSRCRFETRAAKVVCAVECSLPLSRGCFSTELTEIMKKKNIIIIITISAAVVVLVINQTK